MKVIISYKSAMVLLDCNWEKCGSACCRYPFGVFCKEEIEGSECYYLSREGCMISWPERPIACLLFPFVITEDNRLVLHLTIGKRDVEIEMLPEMEERWQKERACNGED